MNNLWKVQRYEVEHLEIWYVRLRNFMGFIEDALKKKIWNLASQDVARNKVLKFFECNYFLRTQFELSKRPI